MYVIGHMWRSGNSCIDPLPASCVSLHGHRDWTHVSDSSEKCFHTLSFLRHLELSLLIPDHAGDCGLLLRWAESVLGVLYILPTQVITLWVPFPLITSHVFTLGYILGFKLLFTVTVKDHQRPEISQQPQLLPTTLQMLKVLHFSITVTLHVAKNDH